MGPSRSRGLAQKLSHPVAVADVQDIGEAAAARGLDPVLHPGQAAGVLVAHGHVGAEPGQGDGGGGPDALGRPGDHRHPVGEQDAVGIQIGCGHC